MVGCKMDYNREMAWGGLIGPKKDETTQSSPGGPTPSQEEHLHPKSSAKVEEEKRFLTNSLTFMLTFI